MSEDRGRPVPPHRSGGGGQHNGHDLGPAYIATSIAEPQGAPEVPLPVAEVEVMVPVFEVVIPSVMAGASAPAYHFKFWGDGKIEGFDALAASRKVVVVNRIPALLDQIAAPLRDFVDEVDAQIAALATNEVQKRAGAEKPPCPDCGFVTGHDIECLRRAGAV